jgi:hypothetical protein
MALADHVGKPKPTPAAAPEPAAADPAEESNVTPEEQDIYDRIGIGARALAYDEATHENVVKMLKEQAAQPAKALANTAMMLFSEVDQKSGGKIPEDMILRSAEGVLDEVIDLAEKTGTLAVDETIANKALQEMILLLGDKYDFDPAEIQAEIETMDPAEVQRMVAQQQQVAES